MHFSGCFDNENAPPSLDEFPPRVEIFCSSIVIAVRALGVALVFEAEMKVISTIASHEP